MKRLLYWLGFGLCSAAMALAQTATSVNGTVTDPSGAVIVDATVTLLNLGTGATRQDHSNQQGHYQFNQVEPGNYRITAEANGFGRVVVNNVQLLVNTPATVPLAYKNVGATTQEVTVEADSAAQMNTEDATLGNVISNRPVVQLPLAARNPTSLLALQPGVTYTQDPQEGQVNDERSGSVNGGKADQANVLLDGVDANDQLNRTSFTSVLRATPDSIEEFREITSNPPASLGFSSGAQVTLVTKSGTNAFHGSAYEYNRNTETEANNFITKESGQPRQALIYNVFGGSLGGPIRKDRLFFFAGYEGRRDASATTQYRIVPTDNFRNGYFNYATCPPGQFGCAAPNGQAQLTPSQVGYQGSLVGDSAGVPAAVLTYLQSYPEPNYTGQGDGLNTAGYAFNAKTPFSYDSFISRWDWHIDNAGKHQIFFRGSLQNDNYEDGAPQFPGQPNSSTYLNNSKGFAVGYTWVVSQSMVNTIHYGFTREGVASTGTQTQAEAILDNLTPLYPEGGASGTQVGCCGTYNQLPVQDIREDLDWIKGRHTWGFGAEVFLLDNHYQTDSFSFSSAEGDGNWITDDGGALLWNSAGAPPAFKDTTYEKTFSDLLGLLPKLYNQTNFSATLQALPQGAMVDRIFAQQHIDLYAQDSWKVKPNLTLYGGVRFSMAPPVNETQGYDVQPTVPAGEWMLERGALAASGQSQLDAGNVTYNLNKNLGVKNWPTEYDWAPRVAFNWAPHANSGMLSSILGKGGQTVIRGGYSFLYDVFGQGLMSTFAGVAGFADLEESNANQPISGVPIFSGPFSVPYSSPIFPATPAPGFPQTLASIFNGGGGAQLSTIDSGVKAPYSMIANFTIERQLAHGFLVQASFVNRESRRSLIGEDTATPTNLVDPASGMSYYQAAKPLEQAALAGVTNLSQIQPIQYWQDLWPGAAGCDINANCGSASAYPGASATQGVYSAFYDNPGDWTTAVLTLDQLCLPACSKLGPAAMFNQQYSANYAFRSVGTGAYNGLQLVLRKAFTNGYQFDLNYTYSKSMDLGSTPESAGYANGGATSAIGSIITTWNPKANYAPSDYDMQNQLSAFFIGQLPFGRGHAFLANSNRFVNGVLGGWEVTSIVRADSAFPASVNDGVGWPTVWDFNGYATPNGPLPSTKNRALGNAFHDPTAAFAVFTPTNAGDIGGRNNIRGTPLFNLDGGINKTFTVFSLHDNPNNLQIRVEGFNLTNSAPLDIESAAMSLANPADFGLYTQTLTNARQFQAVLRYEF